MFDHLFIVDYSNVMMLLQRRFPGLSVRHLAESLQAWRYDHADVVFRVHMERKDRVQSQDEAGNVLPQADYLLEEMGFPVELWSHRRDILNHIVQLFNDITNPLTRWRRLTLVSDDPRLYQSLKTVLRVKPDLEVAVWTVYAQPSMLAGITHRNLDEILQTNNRRSCWLFIDGMALGEIPTFQATLQIWHDYAESYGPLKESRYYQLSLDAALLNVIGQVGLMYLPLDRVAMWQDISTLLADEAPHTLMLVGSVPDTATLTSWREAGVREIRISVPPDQLLPEGVVRVTWPLAAQAAKPPSVAPAELTTNDGAFDVFLAHSWADKAEVRTLAHALTGRGVRCWLDEQQIRPGTFFQDALKEGLQKSRSAAILIGLGGVKRWQEMELRVLIERCIQQGIPVIPVLLPGVTEVPDEFLFLRQLNWVMFDHLDDSSALDRLVWGIRGTG